MSETQEHYIKVAEGFGLSHKEPEVTRRGFLRGLIATGALVAMPPTGLFMPPEPKIHQVSGNLDTVFPNLIDSETGLPIRLRDFREDDKYDTLTIKDNSGHTYAHGKPLRPASWKDAGSMAGLMMASYGMVIALAGRGE